MPVHRKLSDVLLQKIGKQLSACERLLQALLEHIKPEPHKEATPSPIEIKVPGLSNFPGLGESFSIRLGDVHHGIALACLSRACALNRKAKALLHQGKLLQALEHFIHAERRFGSAEVLSHETAFASVVGKMKASIRHGKTASVRARAIKYWRKHLDPKKSVQEAADAMHGIITWDDGTEVANRTLAKWVAAAKKKNRKSQ
jgi:hypothetical protein